MNVGINKITIKNFFVITDNRYICQVNRRGGEEWYIMNSSKIIRMRLYYYIIVDDDNTIIFLENYKYIIKFKIKYKNDIIKYIKLENKMCKNTEDKLLYNLFYDIYRMKKSNYIKDK